MRAGALSSAASAGNTSSRACLKSYILLVMCSSSVLACTGSSTILEVILARHTAVCDCPNSRHPLQPNVAQRILIHRLVYLITRVGFSTFHGFCCSSGLLGNHTMHKQTTNLGKNDPAMFGRPTWHFHIRLCNGRTSNEAFSHQALQWSNVESSTSNFKD